MSTATPPAAAAAPQTKTVTLTIDGVNVTVPEKTTIWEAARQAGIVIPALCHKEDLNAVAVCRVCVVDVLDNGRGRGENLLPASCTRECSQGMKIQVDSERALQCRKTLLELLLAEHPHPCRREQEAPGSCELEYLGRKYGLIEPVYTPRAYTKGTDFSNPSIAIDHSSCILCDRCVRACSEVANNYVIGRMGKGSLTSISFDNNKPMGTSSCVNCGWCMISCPTGAITYSGGLNPQILDTDGKQIGIPLSAEQMKAEVPLLKNIALEFLRRSEGGVVVRRFNKGDVICRQGEFGSTAFYIDSGKVDIFIEGNNAHVRTQKKRGFFNRVTSLLVKRGSDGRREEGTKRYIPIDASTDLDYDRPIAQIGAGELVGEAACLNYQPRSATMVAAEDNTEVLEMLRNVLDIMRRNRQFRKEMEEKYRQRALDNHLRSVAEFRDLPTEFIDRLRKSVQLIQYNPGDVICRQGDPADAFYLVRMGHVKVYESYADGEGMVLTYLSRSQYFGEMGLLAPGGRRTANCSALDHVELVRIGKDQFDEMMSRFPHIRERLLAVAEERAAENRKQIAVQRDQSLDDYIKQGLYQAQSLLILDLEKCTRCDECVKACADAHDGITRLIREGLRYDKYLVTTSCRSCRDPYCMVGCPVGSIRRKGDLQIIIEDHCIGCGRCADNCPYGNINMHPFEVEFTDLISGERRRREGRKAAVCDLCDDQCLTENEEPSCVYACPHDAAHRVNGQTFFDDLVLGARAAEEKRGR